MNDRATIDHESNTTEARIVATPGTCGGKPRIDGHRIRVQDIVVLKERMGMTVDEIVASYPSINSEKIESALQYYRAHREEIDRDLKDEEELADRLEREIGSALVRLAGQDDEQCHPNPPG